LTACSILDLRSDNSSPVATGVSIDQQVSEKEALNWIASYRTLASASSDDQRREYQAAQAAIGKEYSEGNRIRLALALSLPGVPWRDDGKLINLLETPPSLLRRPDSPLHQLLFLVFKQAQERQRLRDEQRKRESDLLDEQKRLRDEQRRHEAELLEERRRNEDLQMKLDALRRIDQVIKQRKHGLESAP
jgi:hypothetical protein